MRALKQLAVSKALAAQGALASRPAAFAGALFMAIADTTIQFATREPGRAHAYKAAGFSVFWEGFTR